MLRAWLQCSADVYDTEAVLAVNNSLSLLLISFLVEHIWLVSA